MPRYGCLGLQKLMPWCGCLAKQTNVLLGSPRWSGAKQHHIESVAIIVIVVLIIIRTIRILTMVAIIVIVTIIRVIATVVGSSQRGVYICLCMSICLYLFIFPSLIYVLCFLLLSFLSGVHKGGFSKGGLSN